MKKALLKKYTEEEINSYLEFVITTNSLEGLPPEISSQFIIEDCLVYIPLSEEILKNLIKTLDNEFKTW